MTKWISALGWPLITAISVALVAAILTLGYKAREEAYYTNLLYQTLAETGQLMADRLKDADQALRDPASNPVDRAAIQIALYRQKISTIHAACSTGIPLYLYLKQSDQAAVCTTFAELTSRPPDGIMDDLLIADSSGRVRYQQSDEGQRWDNIGFLLDDKKPTTAKPESGFFSRKEVSPLEQEFRVFRQTVRLKAGNFNLSLDPTAEACKPEPERCKPQPEIELTLVGLVKQKRLDSEVMALSYPIWLSVVFAAVAIVLSIPMVRVCLLAPLQRLKRRDGIWATASTFLTASLLTFALLALAFFKLELDIDVDRQLQALACKIETNVTAEVARVAGSVVAIARTSCPTVLECNPDRVARPWVGASWTKDPSWASWHEDQVSWLNSEGEQKTKFSFAAPTPAQKLGDREFFRAIVEDRSWKPLPQDQYGLPPRFFVQPVYSRNTAENIAVLSVPFSDIYPQDPQDAPVSQVSPVKVATVAFRPVSLFQTLLPPSYGFAIIDQDSRILFHSQESRNLRERLLNDLMDPEPLRAAVYGRYEREFNTTYLGHDQHFHVKPFRGFAGTPWTLVVFSDKDYFRGALADVVTFSLALYLVYAVLTLIALAFLFRRAQGASPRNKAFLNPLVWLWPNEAEYRGYRGFIAAFAITVAMYAACLFTLPPELLAVLMPFFPLGALIGGYYLTRRNPGKLIEWLEQGRLGTLAQRYTVAAALFVLIVAVLPATAFFRIAFDYKMRELARQGQLQIGKHVEERRDAVKSFLRDRKIQLVDAANTSAFEHRAMKEDLAGIYSARGKQDPQGIDATPDSVYSELPPGTTPCPRAQPDILDTIGQWLPLRDATTVKTTGAAYSQDPQLRWCPVASGELRMQMSGLEPDGLLQFEARQLSMWRLTGGWAIGCAAMVVFLVTVWMYVVNRRLFSFTPGSSRPVPKQVLRISDFPGNTVVLTNLRTSLDSARATVLDLAAVPPGEWSARLAPARDGSRAGLVRFEQRIDDPAALDALIKLLEELKSRRISVVLCSLVDPLLHLEFNRRSGGKQVEEAVKRLPALSRALSGFEWMESPGPAPAEEEVTSAAHAY